MKRKIVIALVLGLCVATTVSGYAQQRSASSRRSQATRAASTTSSSQEASASDKDGVAVPTPPPAPGTPNASRPPRMGGFALMGLQNSARQAASDSEGKVKTSVFLAEFMKAVKAADADGDGKLSSEELNSLTPRRPEGRGSGQPGEGRPQGRRRSNDSSANELDTSTVRAQAPNNERRRGGGDRRGDGGPQGGFPGGPQGGFPGGPQGGSFETPFSKAITDSFDEDGSVDLAKLEQLLKEALDKADADNDGVLSNEEWRAFAGGFGGPGMGGPGMGGPGMGAFGSSQNPNAFRAMQILSLQRDAQAVALIDDGKLDIAKFRSEYVKLLKEADTDKDGVLKEDELQAMQQKVMERMQAEMRERFQNGGPGGFGGMGGPRPGGNGPGGFFNELKNDKGEIDLSKLSDSRIPDQIKQALTEADSDGNGVLNEEEQTAFQNKMRESFQNGGGPGFGGPRGGDANGGRRGSRRNDSSFYAPILPSDANESDMIVRAQESDSNEGGFDGGRRNPNGRGPMGQGGFGFPGGGFPGGGFSRGMGMGGFGGFGRGGVNSVQTAATKAMTDEGALIIADFDKELGKLLNDADNEDDGVLDSLEQVDAFGYALSPQSGSYGRGDRNQGERGPQGDRNNGPRGDRNAPSGSRGGPQGGRGEDFSEEVMRARFLPTPDPNLFVGVSANENFKFSKPFTKDGTAEKVAIESDYAIGKYEVRNREYKEFVDETKRSELPKTWVDGSYPKGTKNCPVVGVTLKDAEDYCEWLGTKYKDWTFRLPTEAEFENAAAGPQKLLFPWGKTSGFTYSKGELTANCQYNAAVVAALIANDASMTVEGKTVKVSDLATITNKGVLSKGWRDSKSKTGFTYSQEFAANSKVGGYLVPVYQFQDNRSPYGCVGMAGNAAEWTSTVVDGKNVVRGGSWYSSAEECSATYRGDSQDPSRGVPTVGFRVVAERI